MNKIKIVDARMGKGKTSALIDKINSDQENKYIYITPFLSEVDRIKKACAEKRFVEPAQLGKGKKDSFEYLLSQGRNVASTHALFRTSDEITRELIANGDYILVLDEVMDVVEQLKIKKDDIKMLIDLNLVSIDDMGLVTWNEEMKGWDSRYNDIKAMANNKSLVVVKDAILMWNFPAEIFKSFKEVYVLTYKFNGQIQRYYYDLFNIEYSYNTVVKNNDKFELMPVSSKEELESLDDQSDIRDLVTVVDNDKLNKIGEENFSLSSTWYKKHKSNDKGKMVLEIMKKNLANFFRNMRKAKSGEIMWTTFMDSKSNIKGKGYSNSFVSCNLRATNDYAERKIMAYCINVFLNPIIEQYFVSKGVEINEEDYALSEMLQWIWRGAIRKGEPIEIYVPSKRMRELLLEYLSK